jgi:hypothetical protein
MFIIIIIIIPLPPSKGEIKKSYLKKRTNTYRTFKGGNKKNHYFKKRTNTYRTFKGGREMPLNKTYHTSKKKYKLWF